jgi:hypothetical protein
MVFINIETPPFERRVIGMTRPWNNLVYRADTDDLSRSGDLWNVRAGRMVVAWARPYGNSCAAASIERQIERPRPMP